MKTIDVIKSILEKWEFPILKETPRYLVFRFQMSYIQVNLMGEEEDTHALTVNLNGSFTSDDDEEHELALRTCNDLNCNLFHVKLYLDRDEDLFIASEFFYGSEEELEPLLKVILHSLANGRKEFINHYNELYDERKFIKDLEQE